MASSAFFLAMKHSRLDDYSKNGQEEGENEIADENENICHNVNEMRDRWVAFSRDLGRMQLTAWYVGEEVVQRHMRDVLRCLSLLVLQADVGSFVDEHLDELEVAADRSVVKRSHIVESSCVDIRSVFDQKLCKGVVPVIGGFVERCPT